ncbi:MAG: hypothetical protein NTZ71_15580 [Planctomycetota bacterium]|nr:hypothetical protein [Planctomycetota bacterium]
MPSGRYQHCICTMVWAAMAIAVSAQAPPPTGLPGLGAPQFGSETLPPLPPIPTIPPSGTGGAPVPPPAFGGPVPLPPWLEAKPKPVWTSLGPDGALWFQSDVGIVAPAVGQQLQNTVYLGANPFTVIVPQAPLDWAAMPGITLGYNIPENGGSFLMRYQLLASQGVSPFVVDGVNTSVTSRLNTNIIDIGYMTNNLIQMPRYDVRGGFGARYSGVYFDSVAGGDNGFFRKIANNYSGAGPTARLDILRQISLVPGLSISGSSEIGVLIGNLDQTFAAGQTIGGSVVNGQTEVNRSVTTYDLRADIGLAYRPPSAEFFQVYAGYTFEQFFNVGGISPSSANLLYQGVLLSFRFDY